jgi:hypothetical protein
MVSAPTTEQFALLKGSGGCGICDNMKIAAETAIVCIDDTCHRKLSGRIDYRTVGRSALPASTSNQLAWPRKAKQDRPELIAVTPISITLRNNVAGIELPAAAAAAVFLLSFLRCDADFG